MTIDEVIFNIYNLSDNYVLTKVRNVELREKFRESLNIAIEVLEESEWKSVKDETPKDDREVLIKLVHTYADDGYYQYSIGRYIKLDGWERKYYWSDYKYGYLEHERYSDRNGGSSYYKVAEWKEI